MPEYLITARSPQGRTATECVDASSADDAVLIMHERGYSEIRLHCDDVGAQYSKPSQSPFSPAECLDFRRHRYHPLRSILLVTRKLYLQGWKMYLTFLAFAVGRRWLQLPWNWIDVIDIGMLFFPIVWGVVAQFRPHPSLAYDKIVDATSWGRWQDVLDLLPLLKGVEGIPVEEPAFRHAYALAGMGRLPEALEILKPFSDGTRMPKWLYWGRLAGVYETAGQLQEMIPCAERATELAPGNATMLLDLAMALLRNQHDIPRAKRLLDECRSHALSDLVIPLVQLAEGVLALEENNNQRARDLFNKSYKQIALYSASNGMMAACLDQIHAYLAITESRLGNPEAARKHFQQAQPRLRALGAHDLLQRCCEELRIR